MLRDSHPYDLSPIVPRTHVMHLYSEWSLVTFLLPASCWGPQGCSSVWLTSFPWETLPLPFVPITSGVILRYQQAPGSTSKALTQHICLSYSREMNQTPGSRHPLKSRGPVVWSLSPKMATIVLCFLYMQAHLAIKEGVDGSTPLNLSLPVPVL